MERKRLNDILLGVLIGAAMMMVAVLMLFTVLPPKRTTKATQYDLDCLTGDITDSQDEAIKLNPLKECKK